MRPASCLCGETCTKDRGFHGYLREVDSWPRWTRFLSNRTEFHVMVSKHSLKKPLALLTLASLKDINTPRQDHLVLMILGVANNLETYLFLYITITPPLERSISCMPLPLLPDLWGKNFSFTFDHLQNPPLSETQQLDCYQDSENLTHRQMSYYSF